MEKWDAKKALKALYAPPRKDFTFTDIPAFHYFMVDGGGGPGSPAYAEAVEALYAAAYTLKFMSKAEGRDYVVPPLQALWWAEDMSDFITGRKENWLWTVMLLIPPFVAADSARKAIDTARAKKGLPGLSLIRVEELAEGTCAQILHIGSYEDEAPTLHRLHHA